MSVQEEVQRLITEKAAGWKGRVTDRVAELEHLLMVARTQASLHEEDFKRERRDREDYHSKQEEKRVYHESEITHGREQLSMHLREISRLTEENRQLLTALSMPANQCEQCRDWQSRLKKVEDDKNREVENLKRAHETELRVERDRVSRLSGKIARLKSVMNEREVRPEGYDPTPSPPPAYISPSTHRQLDTRQPQVYESDRRLQGNGDQTHQNLVQRYPHGQRGQVQRSSVPVKVPSHRASQVSPTQTLTSSLGVTSTNYRSQSGYPQRMEQTTQQRVTPSNLSPSSPYSQHSPFQHPLAPGPDSEFKLQQQVNPPTSSSVSPRTGFSYGSPCSPDLHSPKSAHPSSQPSQYARKISPVHPVHNRPVQRPSSWGVPPGSTLQWATQPGNGQPVVAHPATIPRGNVPSPYSRTPPPPCLGGTSPSPIHSHPRHPASEERPLPLSTHIPATLPRRNVPSPYPHTPPPYHTTSKKSSGSNSNPYIPLSMVRIVQLGDEQKADSNPPPNGKNASSEPSSSMATMTTQFYSYSTTASPPTKPPSDYSQFQFDEEQEPEPLVSPDSEISTSRGRNELEETLSAVIVEEASRVEEEVSGRSKDKVTDVHMPLDPNLHCGWCKKIFRDGEIQKFKKHSATCVGVGSAQGVGGRHEVKPTPKPRLRQMLKKNPVN